MPTIVIPRETIEYNQKVNDYYNDCEMGVVNMSTQQKQEFNTIKNNDNTICVLSSSLIIISVLCAAIFSKMAARGKGLLITVIGIIAAISALCIYSPTSDSNKSPKNNFYERYKN